VRPAPQAEPNADRRDPLGDELAGTAGAHQLSPESLDNIPVGAPSLIERGERPGQDHALVGRDEPRRDLLRAVLTRTRRRRAPRTHVRYIMWQVIHTAAKPHTLATLVGQSLGHV
jgi:hypothetical protein